MIKQNKFEEESRNAVTPHAFVKNTKACADVTSYDWENQCGDITGFATWFKTGFGDQWESD